MTQLVLFCFTLPEPIEIPSLLLLICMFRRKIYSPSNWVFLLKNKRQTTTKVYKVYLNNTLSFVSIYFFSVYFRSYVDKSTFNLRFETRCALKHATHIMPFRPRNRLRAAFQLRLTLVFLFIKNLPSNDAIFFKIFCFRTITRLEVKWT